MRMMKNNNNETVIVTIVRDICATAKGYEAMTVRKIQRNGGMLV